MADIEIQELTLRVPEGAIRDSEAFARHVGQELIERRVGSGSGPSGTGTLCLPLMAGESDVALARRVAELVARNIRGGAR